MWPHWAEENKNVAVKAKANSREEQKRKEWVIISSMKMQLSKRLDVAHVRDTVMQLVTGEIEFAQAMAELQVGKTRLYELKVSFLATRRSTGGSA